ncbi:hypothetical protein H4R34_000003 [Dimargaris verticillata]|uniref:TRAPP trafficking subunit Trs65-domain-containing protein n=1 Tax=Dimargaris verticillata TaxID=2761393 RepID=A0A9W8EFR0_9FUNG|nr:hypothetical protein H4R34_000003 [Dimargaris verticillata]
MPSSGQLSAKVFSAFLHACNFFTTVRDDQCAPSDRPTVAKAPGRDYVYTGEPMEYLIVCQLPVDWQAQVKAQLHNSSFAHLDLTQNTLVHRFFSALQFYIEVRGAQPDVAGPSRTQQVQPGSIAGMPHLQRSTSQPGHGGRSSLTPARGSAAPNPTHSQHLRPVRRANTWLSLVVNGQDSAHNLATKNSAQPAATYKVSIPLHTIDNPDLYAASKVYITVTVLANSSCVATGAWSQEFVPIDPYESSLGLLEQLSFDIAELGLIDPAARTLGPPASSLPPMTPGDDCILASAKKVLHTELHLYHPFKLSCELVQLWQPATFYLVMELAVSSGTTRNGQGYQITAMEVASTVASVKPVTSTSRASEVQNHDTDDAPALISSPLQLLPGSTHSLVYQVELFANPESQDCPGPATPNPNSVPTLAIKLQGHPLTPYPLEPVIHTNQFIIDLGPVGLWPLGSTPTNTLANSLTPSSVPQTLPSPHTRPASLPPAQAGSSLSRHVLQAGDQLQVRTHLNSVVGHRNDSPLSLSRWSGSQPLATGLPSQTALDRTANRTRSTANALRLSSFHRPRDSGGHLSSVAEKAPGQRTSSWNSAMCPLAQPTLPLVPGAQVGLVITCSIPEPQVPVGRPFSIHLAFENLMPDSRRFRLIEQLPLLPCDMPNSLGPLGRPGQVLAAAHSGTHPSKAPSMIVPTVSAGHGLLVLDADRWVHLPKASTPQTLEIQLVALAPGFHTVNCLALVDTDKHATTQLGSLCTVFAL